MCQPIEIGFAWGLKGSCYLDLRLILFVASELVHRRPQTHLDPFELFVHPNNTLVS
jgi:hypothetical protein